MTTKYEFKAAGPQTIPSSALRFRSDVSIAAAGKDATTVPVTLLARSGQPTEHWYFGNVVHDMAGMTPSKPTIPIDYCHDCDQVIGFASKFDTADGDLTISGSLVPYPAAEDDRATEVIYKAAAGVPWEASINFGGDGIVMEFVPEGFSSPVNGYQFEGPGIIVRQWPLRGVAICPYGQDQNTEAEFSEKLDRMVEFKKGGTMLTETTPVAGSATPTPGTSATVLTATDAVKPKPGAEYVEAFGAQGALWHFEGKPFATCVAEFSAAAEKRHVDAITSLKSSHTAEVAALQTQITDLQTKLAAAPRGNDPASFSGEAKSGDAEAAHRADLEKKLGKNRAAFAAGIKLPK